MKLTQLREQLGECGVSRLGLKASLPNAGCTWAAHSGCDRAVRGGARGGGRGMWHAEGEGAGSTPTASRRVGSARARAE